jgi:hypothetical protein
VSHYLKENNATLPSARYFNAKGRAVPGMK